MRLGAQFIRFRFVFLVSALGWPLVTSADAWAELPEAIIAQAPDTPRGEWFPNPGLFLASDGNLYGTTRGQNAVNGTVFKLSGDGSAYSTVLPFSGNEVIYSGLVEGPDGKLYGTIYSGQGSIAKGAVFSVSKTGVLNTLHAFTGPDGANPAGPVLVDSDGTIFGTTFYGGADAGDGFGTVFELDPDGTLTTLYDFGIDDGAAGGANPRSNLVLHSDGSLYGTTKTGGQFGGGTVFQLTVNDQLFVADFGDTNGSGPHDLVLACGDLYGRAFGGNGLIFKVALSTGTVSTLHGLAGSDGKFDVNPGDGPANGGGLILGKSGKLYGVAEYGIGSYTGTVFELALNGIFALLYTFKATTTDGQQPWGIAQGTDGNLYGTEQGQNNGGGIFKLTVPIGFNDPVSCPPGSGSGSGGSAGSNGAGGSAPVGGSSGAGGNTGTGGTSGGSVGPGASDSGKSGGCSCSSAVGAGSGSAFLLIPLASIGLALLRRRRVH
jgi:MYXO-CTERM domain-containing protein